MYIHQLSTWPELKWDSTPLLPLFSEVHCLKYIISGKNETKIYMVKLFL